MGNGNTPDRDLSDVNLFAPPRNATPDNGPSNIQREGYTDYVPAGRQPMQTAGLDRRGMVEIDNGNEVIYAPAGSRVVIRHNNDGGYQQVGSGQNGFIPNFDDTRRQVMASRQTEYDFEHRSQWPASYYRRDQPVYRPNLQNVDSGDWQVQPRPYRTSWQDGGRDPGTQIALNGLNAFATVAGAFLGARLGGGRGWNQGYINPIYAGNGWQGGGWQGGGWQGGGWQGGGRDWDGGGRDWDRDRDRDYNRRRYGGGNGIYISANIGGNQGYYGQNPPNYGWG